MLGLDTLNLISNAITRAVCLHPRRSQIKRTDGKWLYIECMDCGQQSTGIETGARLYKRTAEVCYNVGKPEGV